MECACKHNASLRGAAVNAYISQFLTRAEVAEETGSAPYQCRYCGAPWIRPEHGDNLRPQLIRISEGSLTQRGEEE